MFLKIISGGQTGADQAALDVAIKLGIPYGGWVPKGRKTEAGPLPEKYLLQEMPDAVYSKRTERNVIDSDGTVIFSHGKLTGGSKYTAEIAARKNKPFLHLDPRQGSAAHQARLLKMWAMDNGIRTINVAGSRASRDPLIYDAVTLVLEIALKQPSSGNHRVMAEPCP